MTSIYTRKILHLMQANFITGPLTHNKQDSGVKVLKQYQQFQLYSINNILLNFLKIFIIRIAHII